MSKELKLAIVASVLAVSGQILNVSASSTSFSLGSIQSINTTSTTTQITWQTSLPSSYQSVRYGTTENAVTYPLISTVRCTAATTGTSLANNPCILLTNLQPNTKYYYKVTSYATNTATTLTSGTLTSNTLEITSEEKSFETLLSQPTNFRAEPVFVTNPVSINLNWLDTSNDEDHFELVRTFKGASTTLPRVAKNTMSYTDSDLNQPGAYTYTLRSCDEDNICSAGISATLTLALPTSPQITSATFLAPNSVNLIWKDTSFEESRFEIYSGTSTALLSLKETLPSNATSYTLTGFNSGTYLHAISACNSIGCSPKVYFSPVTVTSVASGVTNPTSTVVVSTTHTTATTTLTTSTATTSPTTTTTSSPTTMIGWGDVATSSTSITTTSTTSIAAVTPTAPSTLASVNASRLSINGLLSNTIRLTWSNSSNNATRIKVYRSSLNSSVELQTISPSVNSYDDKGLLAGTYTYYLSACNTVGCSSSVSTNQIIIPEPEKIQSTEILSNEISNAFGKVIAGSFVSIVSSSKSFSVTALQDGTFTVNVPDGVYTVQGLIPSKPSGITTKIITVTGLKVTNTIEQTASFTKKIIGRVTFTSGEVVTDAEVGAYKKETGEWLRSSTDSNGNYALEVTSGSWDVTVRPKNPSTATWQPSSSNSNLVLLSSTAVDETKELNLTVTALLSSINVTVSDESGIPIPNIGVILDTVSSSNILTGTVSNTLRKTRVEKTNSNGLVTFRDSAGEYFIRTLIANTLAYSESSEQKVSLLNNQTKTATITLKKENKVETATISGTVKFDDGTPVASASISAWSNEGGHSDVSVQTNGTFSLNLTRNQTWHIKASKDDVGKSYVSDEQTIVTSSEILKPIELSFIKNDSVKIPPVVTIRKDVTEQSVVLSEDGARFNLPANGITGSGAINVQIKPTAEAPSRLASTVVSTAYDITVKNTAGQAITKLEKEAEILIPYDEKELANKGVSLSNVVPSYYDESISAWVSVSKFTINKDKKVFVLLVNHLTRFALIAAADTVAPSSPTNIVTDAITPTDVKITWNNPSNDFNHSKIYRSEQPGVFGQVVAAEVFSNSFIDKTYSIGNKIYYYTVRAVDAAGNESTNTNQIAYTPTGSTLASAKKTTSALLPPGQTTSGQIVRMLSLGSEGDDVVALQKALKYDGFYATGPITGYYGKRTENAVFRFQNYYKEELLIPNGYKVGTGVLGAITRKKINEIILKSGQ